MKNPEILKKVTGNVGMKFISLTLAGTIALTGCASESEPEIIVQDPQVDVSEVGVIMKQEDFLTVVSTTIPEEPDFTDSLPLEVRQETLELWLRGSDVSDFCAKSVQIMVQEADLESTHLDNRLSAHGPRMSDRTYTEQNSLVPVNLCLDPSSFDFGDDIISASMTTNPKIHDEGTEGQPDLFITLRDDGTVGHCIEAREETKDLLGLKLTEVGEYLDLDTDYNIKVRVSPGSSYSDSIFHPCDDTAISFKQ